MGDAGPVQPLRAAARGSAAADARCAERVDRRQVGGLGDQHAQRGRPARRPGARWPAEPTIGTVGTPVSARQSAARRWAGHGPARDPSGRPCSARSRGRSAVREPAWSSGLSASAITSTSTSAAGVIGITVTPARPARPRPCRAPPRHGPAPQRGPGGKTDDDRRQPRIAALSANRVSASTKIWWPSAIPPE